VLVLASASPRRRRLLAEWGYEFAVVQPEADESWPAEADPEAGACALAERKAAAGRRLWLERGGSAGDVILGADTIVTLDGRVFGKPADAAEAERMLAELSGRTHKVVTGFALVCADGEATRVVKDSAVSLVRFHKLTAARIRAYVADGEPLDKAGAYGYQGEGRKLVQRVEGSEDNVIGLPMETLCMALFACGVYPSSDLAEAAPAPPPAETPADSGVRPPRARRPAKAPGDSGRRRIADLPDEIKPRERAIRSGVRALSNRELLALLLRAGTPGENVLELAEHILTDTNGLRGLAARTLPELMRVRGIGQAKAALILAALELGRRAAENVDDRNKAVVREPADAAKLLNDMRLLDREHFRVILLNTKNMVLGIEPVSIGSLNTSVVHPRECFKEALRYGANAVILAHNHPSGDPAPSRQDIDLTRRLVESGKILGIEVLDHIIVGDKNFVSMKERGDIV
jgi:DNA repair protein RadC